MSTVASTTPFTSYQRRLIAFLSVATFFDGFDLIALTQILPNLRKDMGLTPKDGSVVVACVNIGTIVAYLLMRYADRWGRKRLLSVTIAGYTLASLATGFATGPLTFTAAQIVARVFLVAEWATSLVYAAEEFPAARRGLVIGLINASSAFGSIVCAGVVPLLLKTSVGWRSVYFVGFAPLVILAFARRNLQESSRFEREVKTETRVATRALSFILSTPYRRRTLLLGLLWFLTYMCTQNAVVFWKEFVLAERGFTDAMAGASVSIAALGSMPMILAVGPMLDRLGRRPGAAVIFVLTAVGIVGSYTLHSVWGLRLALCLGIFGVNAVLSVLNAFNTELFPTHLRGDAVAWGNNLIGRVAYVLAPLVVGQLAEPLGWGVAVSLTAIGPVIALALILAYLPETRGRELEETSAIGDPATVAGS